MRHRSCVVTTLATARRRSSKLARVEVVALALCSVQYVYQWVDQFLRDGYGLEVSFYWSFSYPTFAVALAVMVGRLTPRRHVAAYRVGGWRLAGAVARPHP